jgi:hypothetical protein
MSKILNSISKLKYIFTEYESEFLYCPNASSYCPLPIFGINRQTYKDGECSISFFKGSTKDFKSLDDFWPKTILSGYIHEGYIWNEIINYSESLSGKFIEIDNEKFLQFYNGYKVITSGYRAEELHKVEKALLITDDIGDLLCVCSTENYYYAFHYESSG